MNVLFLIFGFSFGVSFASGGLHARPIYAYNRQPPLAFVSLASPVTCSCVTHRVIRYCCLRCREFCRAALLPFGPKKHKSDMIIMGLQPNNPRAEYHFRCNSNPKGLLEDFPTAIIVRKYVKKPSCMKLCCCFSQIYYFFRTERLLDLLGCLGWSMECILKPLKHFKTGNFGTLSRT